MEVREFELRYRKKPAAVFQFPGDTKRYDSIQITLRGATRLSDNIALSRDTTDSLAIKCSFADRGAPPDAMPEPVLLYEESKSELNTSFDELHRHYGKEANPEEIARQPNGRPCGV